MRGKTIKSFVITDDKYRDLKTVELSNWVGKCYIGERKHLKHYFSGGSMKQLQNKLLLSLLFIFSISSALIAQDRIAVLPFQNNANENMAFMSQGLSDMFITSFSQDPSITVIERSRIQALMSEMELSLTGIVDESSAIELGKLLGANKMVMGSFMQLGSEIRIDARVVDVELGSVIPGASRAGTAVGLENIDNVVDDISSAMATHFTAANSTVVGEPSLQSELIISKSTNGVYTPVVDGTPAVYDETRTTNDYSFMVSHGNHSVKIVKGFFGQHDMIEEYFEIPGGYTVRMRYDVEANTLTIYDSAPTQELLSKKNASPIVTSSTTTTTTTTTYNEGNSGKGSSNSGSNGKSSSGNSSSNGSESASVSVDIDGVGSGSATVTNDGTTETVSIDVDGFGFSMSVTGDEGSYSSSESSYEYSENSGKDDGTYKGYEDQEMTTEEDQIIPVEEVETNSPISNARYQALLNELQAESFEDDRVSALKYALRGKYLTSDQLKGIVVGFDFEDTKLDAAKFGYSILVDKDEFYKIISTFEFSFTREDLREWASNQG